MHRRKCSEPFRCWANGSRSQTCQLRRDIVPDIAAGRSHWGWGKWYSASEDGNS
jgi:hypothetical protein